MRMRLLVVPMLFLLLMGMIAVPQANASTLPSVHFDSSPITTWYNETPYEYAASISAPYNWTLKTNASAVHDILPCNLIVFYVFVKLM